MKNVRFPISGYDIERLFEIECILASVRAYWKHQSFLKTELQPLRIRMSYSEEYDLVEIVTWMDASDESNKFYIERYQDKELIKELIWTLAKQTKKQYDELQK